GHGGFAEISGKNYLSFDGFADLRGGVSWGRLLLDPENINIVASGGSNDLSKGRFDSSDDDLFINRSAIVQTLNGGADVILQASNNISTDADASIITNSTNRSKLTLEAGNSINISAAISLGQGDVVLKAGVESCLPSTCGSSIQRNVLLTQTSSLETSGNIIISAADNIQLNGSLGAGNSNSIILNAGNNITVGEVASISAGKNEADNSPTIFLSAGSSLEFFAPRTVDPTGNIELLGTLTTDGGRVELSATGLVDNTTGTGVINVKNNITTKGGDFIVRSTGDFSNNFTDSVNAINRDNLNGLVDIINTSSTDRSGGGDISIFSGGDVRLGTVKFGYESGGSGGPVRIGSLTVEAGKDFSLEQILNFNNTGTRDPSTSDGRRFSTLPSDEHDPFVKIVAGGNLTIKEGAKILDYYYGDARDSLNVDLHAAPRFNERGSIEYIPSATGKAEIKADIYTAGGNFTASGFEFDSSGIKIDTDKANDSESSSQISGQESHIASTSLGGDVTIYAISAIELGSVIT